MAVSLPKLALSIRKGSAYMTPLRVETGNLSFAAITGMSKSAPLRVIAPAHNIPDGWYAAIVDAGGMTEFNATDSNSIQDREFRRTIRVDADTVDFPIRQRSLCLAQPLAGGTVQRRRRGISSCPISR